MRQVGNGFNARQIGGIAGKPTHGRRQAAHRQHHGRGQKQRGADIDRQSNGGKLQYQLPFLTQKRIDFTGRGGHHQRADHGSITLHRHRHGQYVAAAFRLPLHAGGLAIQGRHDFLQPSAIGGIDFGEQRFGLLPKPGSGIKYIADETAHPFFGHGRQGARNDPGRAVQMRAIDQKPPIARVKPHAGIGHHPRAADDQTGFADLPLCRICAGK